MSNKEPAQPKRVAVKALYALYPPLRFETEDSAKQYYRLLKDFEGGTTATIRGGSFHGGETLIIVAGPCTATQKRRYFKKPSFFKAGDTLLQISTTLTFPGADKFFLTDQSGAKTHHTDEELFSIWKSVLSDEIDLTIQSYLCALMIAYSGAARPIGNVWIVDDVIHKVDAYKVSQIHESIEFLRENNAFPKFDITKEAAVRWVFKQNGIFDGYSDTAASRALNFFTRLFTSEFRNDELSDLVWALAGIEALLVQGGRSSVGQLREKLGAILDLKVDSDWLTKMITESYNYRSRMIHGDRQIKSSFRGDEDADKRFYEEYHSQLFSIGILVLLLQYAISNDLSEIRFKTIVTDSQGC